VASARMFRHFLATALTLALALPGLANNGNVPRAEATTSVSYYVDSVRGDDDNSGTSPTAPWRSLAGASRAVLTPGNHLLLHRGRTWSGPLRLSGSGTLSAPIVVAPYGSGPLPLVTNASSCIVISGSHVIVRALRAARCGWAGVRITGKADVVERSFISGNAAGVDVAQQAVGARIVGNKLIDNNRMSVLTPEPKNDDSGAFGVAVRGDRTEVAFNTIVGSDAFSYDYGRDGSAVEVYGGRGSRIHHNLAVNNNAFTELGQARSSDTLYAYNVVRSSLRDSSFLVTRGADNPLGPVLGTRAYNNTVYFTGSSSQGFVCYAGCSPEILSMRNNIVQAVWKIGYADAPFDEDNDVFWKGAEQFRRGKRTLFANPRFVAAPRNLRLRASSPAVDRGTELGYRVDFDRRSARIDGDGDGNAVPDAGAYEYRRLRRR